jgi:hypothetical protein
MTAESEEPEPSEGVVYVLGAPGSSTVKIGTTKHLSKRLGDIQRMSPVPLTVLWTHPGGHDLETNLHRHFKELRSHGEWFTFHSDPVRLVRWAVEDQPWLRPKVRLTKPKRRPRTTPKLNPILEREPGFRRHIPPSDDEVRALAELLHLAETMEADLGAISDPVQKYRAAIEAEARKDVLMKAALREMALTAKNHGLTWREIGEILGGVSAQRAHQISKYPPLPN